MSCDSTADPSPKPVFPMLPRVVLHCLWEWLRILDNSACSKDVVTTDLSWIPFCCYDWHPHFVDEDVCLVHIWKCCVYEVSMFAIHESEILLMRMISRYCVYIYIISFLETEGQLPTPKWITSRKNPPRPSGVRTPPRPRKPPAQKTHQGQPLYHQAKDHPHTAIGPQGATPY